jgi:hypothetical protein
MSNPKITTENYNTQMTLLPETEEKSLLLGKNEILNTPLQ